MAGNGLLSNRQRRLRRLKRTVAAWRAHAPVLLIHRVRSAQHPAFTPPNVVEPATESSPGGESPETFRLIGPAGSSLVTVIIPGLGPKLSGLNRIGSGKASPGLQ